jgi:hypothetical protein
VGNSPLSRRVHPALIGRVLEDNSFPMAEGCLRVPPGEEALLPLAVLFPSAFALGP